MLERLSKNSQSLMIVVLVASLAMIFGTQFGNRPGGCSADDFKAPTFIAKVYGNTISQQDFQSLARLVRLSDGRNPTLRRAIVNGLVERELLAHEAERVGLRVTDDELNREITGGYIFLTLGVNELEQLNASGTRYASPLTSRQGPVIYSQDENRGPNDPPPPFKVEDFQRWVANAYARTVADYKLVLEREVLAERMRQLVIASVRASDDEVWREYERNHTQVSVRYVRFSPEFYRTTVPDDDDAAVNAFAASHQEQINTQFTQRRDSLRGLPAQVRIRHILLRFPDDAQDPAKLAIRQRLEALRTRITAGENWVRLARLYSQDDHWREGGLSSWTAVDRVDLPDDVKRVLPNLQAGQMSEVIQSPLGVHLIQVVGRRQGDVPEADAKREIARDLFRLTRGNELANEAALAAQRRLGEAGATLETVAAAIGAEALAAFYRGPVPATETLPGNNPLTPETRSDLGTPEVKETPAFTQTGSFPGVSDGDALVAASFALTAERPAPAAPINVGDDRFLIRLKDNGRQNASRSDFERDRMRLQEEFIGARRRDAIVQYVARLRTRAERDRELRLGNSPLMQEPRRETEGSGSGASGSSGSGSSGSSGSSGTSGSSGSRPSGSGSSGTAR
ncbi:MAG: peptidylprolyl isomerase [Myxococcales bacterium]|nr:peptidylprolyl isomerase [Myxococcales bacterium]